MIKIEKKIISKKVFTSLMINSYYYGKNDIPEWKIKEIIDDYFKDLPSIKYRKKYKKI